MARKLPVQAAISPPSTSEKPTALEAAERLERWARANGIGRTLAWQAAHPDPEYRRGLPFLPTFTLGRCRLIRIETASEWLRGLERASSAGGIAVQSARLSEMLTDTSNLSAARDSLQSRIDE